jgi:ABC-2 type transport system permease protein
MATRPIVPTEDHASVAAAGRAPRTLIARLVGRRAARSGAGWGVVFGIYVASSLKGYTSAYPTAASRAIFARTFGSNAGIAALLGPAHHLDTAAGFTAWRCLGVLSVVGAVWGLLTSTRLLRGEEDAGRWELLLSGQTTRRRAGAQGLVGLGTGLAALWFVTALITVAVARTAHPRISVGSVLFFSVALVSGAAVFLAGGALAGNLAATRRQAAGLAGAVLGVAFLIRMVADSGSGLHWLAWASPLGWIEELHPLTGPNPWPLFLVVGLVALLCVATVHVAGTRDLGASVLPDRDRGRPHTTLLGDPTALALRLTRSVGIGWLGALAATGLVFGLVAQSAAASVSGSKVVSQALARLGGHGSGAQAYLGFSFVLVASLVAVVACGQVSAARDEESSGRLDDILVRPVGRLPWLAGRLTVAAGLLLSCSMVAALAAWLGAVSQHTRVGLVDLLQAGVNAVPPALFVLGVGALVLGTAPRAASFVVYALVSWSFLVELIGSVIRANHWLLDSSILIHMTPAPATAPDWTSAAVLTVLGLGAATLGGAAFSRRDLASA